MYIYITYIYNIHIYVYIYIRYVDKLFHELFLNFSYFYENTTQKRAKRCYIQIS